MFNIGSNETVNCSKGETENISWHNGSTGVKIKSGGRIELNGLSLKIKNLQLDDAGTYECRGESSTRFYTIYANGKLFYARFVCHHSIIFITTTIMQSFFDILKILVF